MAGRPAFHPAPSFCVGTGFPEDPAGEGRLPRGAAGSVSRTEKQSRRGSADSRLCAVGDRK